MSTTITSKLSRNGQRKWYTFDFGKQSGQRKAAGIFTYVHPRNKIEKRHNEEALALLDTKKSELTLECQSFGTSFIPSHRFRENFLDYYAEFVINNVRAGNRHLESSLGKFKLFIKKAYVPPHSISSNVCFRFNRYLLDRHSGKTPEDYFRSFKRVIKSATRDGYFRINPAEDIRCKTNPSKRQKEFLESDEYIALIETPIANKEVRDAFIFCCYTGLRWCDVTTLSWGQIKQDVLIQRIIQKKTGKPVELFLHPVARQILDTKIRSIVSPPTRVFRLPTANGANKSLKGWIKNAGINKYITWKDARLSFSILLQDANVDAATVALLLGHSTTRYVNETYKRYRPKNQQEHIMKLPEVEWKAS